MPSKLLRLITRISNQDQIARLQLELDMLRSRLDLDATAFENFQTVRQTDSYREAFTKSEPLVSICVATYNRSDLLISRSLPSILNQSYKNIEVVVVGDCCTDDTFTSLKTIKDSRLKSINCESRGNYPADRFRRWMVGGTNALNHALSQCSGDFITHLDDDDEHSHDRIERLLRLAQMHGADVVYHPFYFQNPKGRWRLNSAANFQVGSVTTSSLFYHNWFKRIGWDIDAHLLNEPGDWNRYRKFRYLGATTLRCPTPLLRHYREMSQENV